MGPCSVRTPDPAGNCRHGGIFYGSGARASYRDYPGHRNDGELHTALTDAERMLCGNGGYESAGQCAHLRFTTGTDAEKSPDARVIKETVTQIINSEIHDR